MNNDILICSCSSMEHQIVISQDPTDFDENIAYLHIHLSSRPFWSRIKYGIKYIFGRKCKYGHWDEFIFENKHIPQLEKLVTSLKAKELILNSKE